MCRVLALNFLVFLLTAVPSVPISTDQTNQVWYVASFGNNDNSCASVDSPCASISRAISAASSGDMIYVASGIYTGTGDEVVRIEKQVSLSGGWNADFSARNGSSIVDGQGERRGVFVGNVDAVIDSFTIQNGRPTGSYQPYGDPKCGGGIFNLGRLTLNNSTIKNNVGGAVGESGVAGGAGICNWYLGGVSMGKLILNNSTVSGNRVLDAFLGGGIFNAGGKILLNNSTVSDNAAAESGGIYNMMGALSLQKQHSGE